MTTDKRKKPTKAQLELAHKIVEQKATIEKRANDYNIDLITVIGFRHESLKDNKKAAIAEAAGKIADLLANGELVLADDWEKQNVG